MGGPAAMLTITKRLYPKKAPTHLHKTDTFRMDFEDIIKSYATSGWLADFRMSDALYTSSADTSTPVTTDGDLVGRVTNQSTASASTGWFLNEATSKPQWVENYGLASAAVFGNDEINDNIQSTGWTILDGMTTVLAVRIPQSARDTYTASPFAIDESGNKFAISARLKGDGVLYARSVIGTGVDHTITPDANDVAVIIMQTTSDGQLDASATVDIYCNNTFVVQRSAASQLNNTFPQLLNLLETLP